MVPMAVHLPPSPPPWLARLWEWGGAAGAVLSVLLAVVAWVIVDSALDTFDESLTVTSDGLTAVGETLEIADGTLLVVIEASDRLGASVEDMGGTAADVSAVIRETSALLSEDLPGDIEAIRRAMDGLVDTANVVDGVLGALSFVGVPYDPEVPMDEALVEVDARIAALAPRLQAQGARLGEVATDIEQFGTATVGLGADLAELGGQLERSQLLLGGYRQSIDTALASVDTTRSDLTVGGLWARVMIITATLLGMLMCSAVWWLGRERRGVVTSPAEQVKVGGTGH